MSDTKLANSKTKKPKQHLPLSPMHQSSPSLLSCSSHNSLPAPGGKHHGGNLSENQSPRGANGHGEKSGAREAVRSWRPQTRRDVRHQEPYKMMSQSLALSVISPFIMRSSGACFLLSNDAPFSLFTCTTSAVRKQ